MQLSLSMVNGTELKLKKQVQVETFLFCTLIMVTEQIFPKPSVVPCPVLLLAFQRLPMSIHWHCAIYAQM